MDAPTELIDQALDRRAALLRDPQTTALRLFHGETDGVPGLVIERFRDVLVAQLHENRLRIAAAAARSLCYAACERLDARAVYRKTFPADRSTGSIELSNAHCDPTPWIGQRVDEEITVTEAGVRYLVRPYDGFSVGLFLDQRENRARLRAAGRGARVLNLFAYTCGFAVAAALGGARETVNVDASRKVLEWGKRNFERNGLSLDKHRFFRSDVSAYFRRARRQGHRFDLAIVDPPSFGRARDARRPFVLDEDLEQLVSGAAELLDDGGLMLISVNHRGIELQRLISAARSAAGRRGCELLETPALPLDFGGDANYSRSVLVRFG